jgi:putative chitinase
MNIHELATYNLDDAVKFHQRLNPVLWARDEHLLPEVRDKLLRIAADFQEFLGVEDLKVKDITVSGSNAAYSYTKQSDIDLHLVVEMPDDPVYQELFAAKKYQYNNEHDITIGGADVELYVQPDDQPHHSQGIYSIKNSDWVKVPQRKRSQIDDTCVLAKVDDLTSRIQSAVASQNKSSMDSLWNKIKIMRQTGLENHGEFGCDNVSFKLLRNNGSLGALKSAITAAQDRELSLPLKKRVRYGFSEDVTSTPDGVSASTNMFLNETPIDSVVQAFIKDAVQQLNIEHMPEVVLHNDASWSKQNNSFGQYNPGTQTLHVSLANRHLLDILRTVAHELTHCRQNELSELPDDAGATGSPWENEANAQAGILMRDFADANPEYFTESYTQAKSLQSSMKTFRAKVRIKDRYNTTAIDTQVVARNYDMAKQLLRAQYGPDSVIGTVTELKENASGYIPKNKKEAAMPQYAMALSVDIKPGQVGKEANKLGLKTGRNGEPSLLSPSAQNLLREFAEFSEEQDNLFEITMSPSSLKKLSAQTGALAGMEFEMIVPNTEGNDDGDLEPDYDFDQRCRSIGDAMQFFFDGDYNGRRDVERMRERMQNDFQEWLDDKLYREWERSGEEYLEEWVPNNVDESEWNPEGLEGDDRQEALAEFIANMHADPGSSDAFDEFREELEYDESDWLDDEDLDRMSSIENTYSMSWPHWTSGGSGETSIEDVADSFSNAVGRDVKASSSYHSGRVERPSTRSLHYIVEPDGSIDVDNRDDRGLEFVSPPLPIEELLSDLTKVKAWADKTGCYTNDSTGLHINVSVPGWTQGTDQLDYVKLALLLGDEHVLESFGRLGNTYAKSAMGKIVDMVRQNPNRAQLLMNRMKQGLDQLATRLVHGRQTEKYTSINVKDGYIEFRSPGGDWLNDKFPEIENTLRRFTVALSAAVDPDAYRQEYLKKLYKLLDVSGEKDPLSYFAKYAAGELPKAALKSFVRQAQLERGVNRGKDTRPMWWRVYKEGKNAANGAVIEVVASNKEEALDKAAKEWRMFSDQDRRGMDAEPVRPYKQEAGFVTLNGRPSNPDGNYVIVNADTQAPAYRYMASDMTDATLVLRQWITANPGTQWDFKRDPEMRLGQPGQQQSQGVDTRVDYELYSRASGAVIDTFPARNDDEARIRLDDYRQHGAGQSNPDNFGVRRAGRAAAPAAQQQDDVTPFEIYNRDTGAVVSTVLASNAQEALAELDQFRAEQVRAQGITIPRANALYGVQHAPIPGSTIDLQRQRAAAAQDQQQGGIIDVATDQPAPQPAGMGQWNGQWKVLVNGQEVYRFGNIGNSQADANRIAAAWLRQNGQGVSGEGFEVYPVMAESLREYKMPQPSQGPGKYRDLNEPLGPEFPPTMPAGTVKVDVSDVYDWYKLGQHISNMKDLGQHDFGQGPPSAIMSFGDEDLEHQYIQALKRTGLTTTDIDPVDPDQPPGMPRQKTDPTYNVDEGINEGNQLTLRDFVVTISPHALSQAYNKGVDVDMVDDMLRNISTVKDRIMSLEPGRALILHNGQGTGLGVRRGQGNQLTLATVFPTSPGFRKGKHPTFRVETNNVDEDVRSALATAALAGTMAMGAQAKAPDIVQQVVEPGDTVYSIARQSGADPKEIYRLNKMDRNTKLEIGQRVLVPDYSKPISKMPATVAPTVKQLPAPSLKDKLTSMIPKFSSDDKEEEGITLLSDNTDAEAALQTAAKAAGLKGPELAQFMAQTRHESWDFGKMKEVGNKKRFAKYDAPRKAKQLGNKVKGDGELFKGRGFIQLTGRDNYTRASQQIFGDDRLVKNPDLASRLDVGAEIALWFWKNQVRPNVSNFNNTKEVTNAINPGLSGLQDRHIKFKEYMAVL